jgi:hypothetical protein
MLLYNTLAHAPHCMYLIASLVQYSKLKNGTAHLRNTLDYHKLIRLLKVNKKQFQPKRHDYVVVNVSEGMKVLTRGTL